MNDRKKVFKIDKSQLPVSITICIMCFIIVYIMCIQFKTAGSIEESNIETMRENELREALANWKQEYQDVNKELQSRKNKIKEYQDKIASNDEAGELLEEEYKNAKMLLGLTDVQGTGVIITLTDNSEAKFTSEKLMDLINELNSAGAEAISINDQRIVSMTDIVDVGDFIMTNGKRLTSPYTVKAIGDSTYLQSALSIKNGYLDKYKIDGYTMSITTENNVIINKYEGEMTLNYVK